MNNLLEMCFLYDISGLLKGSWLYEILYSMYQLKLTFVKKGISKYMSTPKIKLLPLIFKCSAGVNLFVISLFNGVNSRKTNIVIIFT